MMKGGQKFGRPVASRSVRVVPESHKEPDTAKLGRALIAVVIKIKGKKIAEGRDSGQNDSVP